jgi:hypothetical protein
VNVAFLPAEYQKHFDVISKEFGYKLSPPEGEISSYGYNALNNKHYTIFPGKQSVEELQ